MCDILGVTDAGQKSRVRFAGAADLDALAALHVQVQALHAQALPQEFNAPDAEAAREFFERQLYEPGVLALLAEEDGRVPVGYLFAREFHRDPNPFTVELHVLYVDQMGVAPNARRTGVGRALMAAAEAEARNRSLHGIRLNTWTFNGSAHRFFERAGFYPYSMNMQLRFDFDGS